MLLGIKMKISRDSIINITLFTILSVTWGFTWLCGKWQINNVIIPEFAVFYRFIIASFTIFLYLLISKKYKQLLISKKEFRIVFIYSAFAFSANFILFYYAALHFVTGFSAIVFSFSIILSYVIGNWFFDFQNKIGKKLYISAALGIVGLVCVMWPNLQNITNQSGVFQGLSLCLIATLSFVIGSVFYESKTKIIKSNFIIIFFWCLVVGAFWSLTFGIIHTLIDNREFVVIPVINKYFVITLLYLAIPSSALGYLCFTILIKRIGSVKASYSSLISPIIAIAMSSSFENYKIGIYTFIGVAFVTLSKFIMFKK
jgi:drug/metabolite transporter (DMT)-like permease